jgi:hypothetical protein
VILICLLLTPQCIAFEQKVENIFVAYVIYHEQIVVCFVYIFLPNCHLLALFFAQGVIDLLSTVFIYFIQLKIPTNLPQLGCHLISIAPK